MRRRAAQVLVLAGLGASLVLATGPQASAAAAAQEPPEIVAEVRIHGNYTTPDADVLKLAGLTVGEPLEPGTIEEAMERLRRSGRFVNVEIRKRFRSMSSTTDIVLVIIVQEHPMADEGPPVPISPLKRMVGSMQVLPVLNYVDGYGFTYGGRVSFANALGRESRISVPLTWGGTKRAAIELDKSLPGAPVDRLEGGGSISSVENPYYELGDDRVQAWFGASRKLPASFRAGGRVGYADVTFGSLEDRLLSYGADLTYDTRIDPVFPRNAVFASAAWDGLDPRESSTVNRFRFDARGYLGLVGQTVLSVRWQYGVSSGTLPSYEKFLLGGASTLRGYRAGSFAGDNLMAATAEFRVPLSSPLGVSRIGLNFFGDVGAAYDHGTRLADTRFRPGGGVGFFVLASVFKLNFDVGFREGGHARLHFSTGLQF